MSDEKKEGEIINLFNKKRERERAIDEAEFKAGKRFLFVEYQFNDDHVGFVDDGKVCIVLDEERLTGVWMTKKDARQLAVALMEASEGP